MAGKYQRYEAVVKLSNGAVVPYHNINTGLLKFHRFVMEKFSDTWLNYSVRRKENKEIVGRYNNSIFKEIEATKIFFDKASRNNNNSGFFLPVKVSCGRITMYGNLFFSDKIVLENGKNFIVVYRSIFTEAIEKLTTKNLSKFSESLIENIKLDLDIIYNHIYLQKQIKPATTPLIDYP